MKSSDLSTKACVYENVLQNMKPRNFFFGLLFFAMALLLSGGSANAGQSCCVKAKAKGKECEHECCIKAHKEHKLCEKCQKDANNCCDKAIAQGKDCPHSCCKEATKEHKICEKCNRPEARPGKQ